MTALSTRLAAAQFDHCDRAAIWIGGVTHSYAELSALGAAIVDRVAPEASVIAIVAERRLATYAVIHACMVRGLAYVPINPRWPAARIEQVLAAARPDVVIVDDGVPASAIATALIGPFALWRIVALGNEAPAMIRDRAGEASRSFDAAGIAYVMFTSGSTGRPKGVPIPGEAVNHYVSALGELARFGADDRFIHSVELTFDLSVHDMALCWSAGAMLCVVPEGSAPLGPRFVRQLEATSWLTVPSVAAQAKNSRLLKPGSMPSLRTSFFCGEALPGPLASTWRDAAPDASLFNLYGPTEATIAFSSFDFTRDPLTDPIVPLGFPIGGQAMTIDPLTDEILLSGAQLSPGYIDDPTRTAAAFVTLDGERWYRTGDRGVFDPLQGFIYHGRLDSQIKLRGYRVELGDVEAALRKHSGSDLVAAVAIRELGPSAFDGLVGVLTGTDADMAQIRRALRSDLPAYMVPETLIALDEMPRNGNGKIDRIALRRIIEDDD